MSNTTNSEHIKYITPPHGCTGCGLCANVCPRDTISMEWSDEGFLVPQVDATKCINCGACVRMCPAQPMHLGKLKEEAITHEPPDAYGGWNSDKTTQLNSSSGGIFTELAKYVFAAGGCVFGVIWSNKNTAEFAKAETLDELLPMRGSKYTQAVPGTVYREVKTELKKGRKVLFVGTSCQVYALNQYLRKDYENLLTVDILCHGVPSRHLLTSYIREFETATGKELERIQFRDKAGNWQQYHVKKIFADGSTLSHMNRKDMFIQLFIGDFALNEACYSCPHARFPRVGDITLGDFWGDLRHLHPDWPIRDGIESLLANTSKGTHILQTLKGSGQIQLHVETLEHLLQGQRSTYLRQASVPANRESILRRLKKEPIPRLYRELCQRVQCGPFHFKKNSLMHRVYNRLKRMKNQLIGRPSRSEY